MDFLAYITVTVKFLFFGLFVAATMSSPEDTGSPVVGTQGTRVRDSCKESTHSSGEKEV